MKSKKRGDGGTKSFSTRFDNLQNPFLGYGTERDKLAFGMFTMGAKLTDPELDAMYYSDDVSAKIVNARPEEMLRRGYRIGITKDGKFSPEGQGLEQLRTLANNLDLNKKFLRAMQWGRLRGGALIVIGALDGATDLSKPLNVTNVGKVLFLNVVDRRYASVVKWQDNALAPNYGEAEIYQIATIIGGVAARVHYTRVIRFDGVEETDPMKRRELGGWTHSALQRPYDVIRKFATSYDSLAQLMADASQGVWKIQGLMDLIANDPAALRARLAFSDMSRSSGRAIMVDTEDEDYQRIATPFSGVDAVIDRFLMRVASAADMPVTKFFGRSAAGMNATGEGDTRDWYDTLSTEQVNVLKPMLVQVYTVLAAGKLPEGFDIEFVPLWEPTAAEKATTEKTQEETKKLRADRHAVYVELGVYTADDVALLLASGDPCAEVEIDAEAVRSAKTKEIELQGMGTEEGCLMANGEPVPPGGEGAEGLNGTKVVLAPTDAAGVVTVNEARKAMGLGPLTKAGAVDPDGELTVAEFRAKREATATAEVAEEHPAPVPPGGGFPGGDKPPSGPKDGEPTLPADAAPEKQEAPKADPGEEA